MAVLPGTCLNRETRTLTNSGLHLDLVPKQFHRAANDEQPQPEPVRLCRIEAMKRFKNFPQTPRRNANAGVEDLDANEFTAATNTNKDPATWGGELHGISYEILESAAHKDGIAFDHCPRWDYAKLHSSLKSQLGDILAELGK